MPDLVHAAPRREVLAQALGSGRHGFGRFFHAALFLYQKLRTLVPSELFETMQDPLSKFVPVPFYVLPYKVQHALRGAGKSPNAAVVARGLSSSGSSTGALPPPPPPAPPPGTPEWEAWLDARVRELED